MNIDLIRQNQDFLESEFHKTYELYFEDILFACSQLKELQSEDNSEEIMFYVHKYKSSSALLGATCLCDAFDTIELHLKNRNHILVRNLILELPETLSQFQASFYKMFNR